MTIIERFHKPMFVNHCPAGSVFSHDKQYWLVTTEPRAGIVEAVNLRNGSRRDFDYSVEVALVEAELHILGVE